jgi:hypothetical protein
MANGTLVLIESGGRFVPISDELEGSITEIRVEQHLDEQTTFAIRFQEDFTEGRTQTSGHEQLNRNREIVIAVPNGPDSAELVCLVRGLIEQTDFDVATGGPGSWFEIRGQDLRTLGTREVAAFEHAGNSDAVMKLISASFGNGNVEVAAGAFEYIDEGEMYRYRGTALEGLEALARRSNLHFWMTYAMSGGLPLGWNVDFTINLLPSPARDQDPKVGPDAPLDKLTLARDEIPELVILGDDNETVVNFRVSADFETVTAARAEAVDRDGDEQKNEVDESPDAPVTTEGRVTIGGITLAPAVSGQPWYNIKAAEAAVTEGSWFVTAQATTSAHMLGAVLEPHQLVKVIGAGCDAAGVYQVSDVTHVINAAEHWMEIQLRTNSLPKEEGNAQA